MSTQITITQEFGDDLPIRDMKKSVVAELRRAGYQPWSDTFDVEVRHDKHYGDTFVVAETLTVSVSMTGSRSDVAE